VLQTLLPQPNILEIVRKLPFEDRPHAAYLSQHLLFEGGIDASPERV
jgi:hypothetical protein